ncbi:beta-lactamase family protein [Bacillus shivajii]|uniref:serine hydrolase domain-containing protein n=1 Tax=Bacillus shivajii TaxID=1983719 RepID=UPI001CFC0D62|nr:serine hydrolase domain-containing protein [Bacillus shivajii]UCZ55008.1 beta-lactamase family protein [Bacillus shivajii]
MQMEERIKRIEEQFKQMVQKDIKVKNAHLLVHSEKLDIHLNLAEGKTGNISAHPAQPYYIASVGKLFTSVLIAMLVERGELSFEDKICAYLDADLLDNLHVYKGTDYTNKIRIKHLLNHKSGLHDFYDDKPKQGKALMDFVFEEPSRFWKPEEVIQWANAHLTPHFPPGKGFHYSDSNYALLGLTIEKITGKPFQDVLKEFIFAPLGMNHSYLLQFSEPIEKCEFPMADFFIRNKNMKDYRSYSIDYAGGGIVAPGEDLLKFMKALVKYELINETTLQQMKTWEKFRLGIDYGYGMMKFKSVPLMMPKKMENMWGNAGITGTFMFYHPGLDTYLIGGLNQFRYNRKSFMLMFKVVNILSKV